MDARARLFDLVEVVAYLAAGWVPGEDARVRSLDRVVVVIVAVVAGGGYGCPGGVRMGELPQRRGGGRWGYSIGLARDRLVRACAWVKGCEFGSRANGRLDKGKGGKFTIYGAQDDEKQDR